MYLKIVMEELPKIKFAHVHATEHYDLTLGGGKHFLEIGCYQQGDTIWEYEDGTEILYQVPQLNVRLGHRKIRAYSLEGAGKHITVGLNVRYSWQRMTREELLADYQCRQPEELAFYFPEEGLPSREDSPAETLLQQLINRFAVADREQSLRCMSILFELLGVLTAETVRMAMLQTGTLSPAGLRYAHKAVRYIADHLPEKLTVEDLAEQLNISTGYLSALFKAYTGTSVIKYVNAAKMEQVRQLLLFRHMSLREAGESVGISDENYCSRLFRQYTGMSVREYLRRQGIHGDAENGMVK